MNIGSLIDKQTIKIDDHKWGSGEIKQWDLDSIDIHIEKKTHAKLKGRNDEVLIKILINSAKELTIKNKRKEIVDEVPRYLEKEIKEAFKNKKTRQDFIFDLIKVLTDFQSNLDNLEKAKTALTRIGKHFGLDYEPYKIKQDITDVLKSYTEQYVDSNGRKYFVTLDRNKIKLGEVDNWTEIEN